MNRIASSVLLCWVALALNWTNSEAATHTRIKYVAIDPRPGTIEVDVSRRVTTSIQALDEIVDWDLGDGHQYTAAKNSNDPRRMTLQPKVAKPQFTTLQILSGGHWYTFELRLAEEVRPVSSVIFVPTKDDIPEQSVIVERSQPTSVVDEKQLAEALSSQRAVYEARIERSEEIALLTQLRESTRLHNARSCDGNSLSICRQSWTPFKQYGVLRFLLSNRTSKPQILNSIAVHDEFDTGEHSGLVSIDEREPTKSTEVNATLAPGQSVVMAVSVRHPDQVGRNVKVAVGTVGRSLPKLTTIELDPAPEEGEGLITLSLQGIAGAVWLANPVDTAQIGATPTAGLELRVRYGFDRLWSFEAALAGARSGDATWDGMMYENQEGEIARNATFGRLLASGLLHFGDKYRPIIQAGLGFQGVNHDSQFTPATGAEQVGPGEGFAGDVVVVFGAGFEARVGQHWTAGLGAKVVSAIKESPLSTTIEGGLHLSYNWIPGR